MCVYVCKCLFVLVRLCICMCMCVCVRFEWKRERAPVRLAQDLYCVRHKLQHRPAPFIYLAAYFCYVFIYFFFPVILVYRPYIQVYNNVAGFGWVGDFILLTRLHTVRIISAEYIRVNWYTYIIYLLHVYYIYYTILLFLLGRIDIGIHCNYQSRSHTLRRIIYYIYYYYVMLYRSAISIIYTAILYIVPELYVQSNIILYYRLKQGRNRRRSYVW